MKKKLQTVNEIHRTLSQMSATDYGLPTMNELYHMTNVDAQAENSNRIPKSSTRCAFFRRGLSFRFANANELIKVK